MKNSRQNRIKIPPAKRLRYLQLGQSMIEYTVVTVFGVLVLTTGPGGNVVIDLVDAIRSNYEGYTYAVSLSDYPDKENTAALIALYYSQGMPTEQIQYLLDSPEDMFKEIMNYNVNNFPRVQEGRDLLEGLRDNDDLCSHHCPLSFAPTSPF
jgi:hypothetical protein